MTFIEWKIIENVEERKINPGHFHFSAEINDLLFTKNLTSNIYFFFSDHPVMVTPNEVVTMVSRWNENKYLITYFQNHLAS